MSESSGLTRMQLPHQGMRSLICAIVLLDFLAAGILIPLIPPLVRQFNPQAFAVGLTFTAFAIGQFFLSPLLGVLSDRYGRKPILLASTLGGMLSCFILDVANSLDFLLVSRFLDGLTGGTLLAGQAYMADITAPEQRARNFGWIGAAVGLGFIFGPALGGALSQINSRFPIFVAALLYLMTSILILHVLPESLPASRRRTNPVRWGDLNPFTQLLQALQRRSLQLFLLVVFLLNFAENGLRSNLQVLTAERFGLSIVDNAILFSYLGLLTVLIQGWAIRPLTERVSERVLTIAGLGSMAMGYSGIALASSVGLLYGALSFNAIGFGLASPTLLSRLSKEFQHENRASSSVQIRRSLV
ncbi:MAG: TCR/Tet family MFS transporter [Leptolyngbyaceae cyanobacterium RM1_405_57]|nr:TCR/Tet family MFS transporter [Leptolyngbyaceae cyanobacterium RM1_405_57]